MATAPSILLTGTSGYLGGTVLARLLSPETNKILTRNSYNKIYCLVRTDAQVSDLQNFIATNTAVGRDAGIEPIRFDHLDLTVVKDVLRERDISVVFYLVDAFSDKGQRVFIQALGGLEVEGEKHFLHTTGAKMFSSHVNAPTDRPLLDDEEGLYEIQKGQKAKKGIEVMQTPIDTNNTVIELCEKHGVKSYIFAPCIVYGKGEGFGNPISIQTKCVVQSAKALRRVYAVDEGEPIWPVCHVTDTATLYLHLLAAMLSGGNPPSGKQGYYLASPGTVKWIDLYRAMAKALFAEGVVDTDEVIIADEKALEGMAKALKCTPEFVPVQVGGNCTFETRRGRKIGWRTEYSAAHAVESAEEEVKLILANL